jgi:hypothetical protein
MWKPNVQTSAARAKRKTAGRAVGATERRVQPPRSAKATPETVLAYAKTVFEQSTGLRWTPTVQAHFAGWFGPAVDYRKWNEDYREARRLRAALERVVKYARAKDTHFRKWIASEAMPPSPQTRNSPGHENAIEHLLFWLQTSAPHELRKWSLDVRVVRYLNLRNFLHLGRRPTVQELTAASILLGPKPTGLAGKTVAAYWRLREQRIREIRKDHPKGNAPLPQPRSEAEAEAMRVKWPPTEKL